MKYQLVHGEVFQNQILDLPPADLKLVIKKLNYLMEDPLPDGDLKKKLKGFQGKVYRIRQGDYRIIYTVKDGLVKLLGIRRRRDAYDANDFDDDDLAFDLSDMVTGDDVEQVEPPLQPRRMEQASHHYLTRVIDADVLRQWQIPEEFWPRLVGLKTEEDLLAAQVPEWVQLRIIDVIDEPSVEHMMTRPTYETGDIEDLLKFVEGELLGFLLKLDLDQERAATWGLHGSGPTLVKGGPGSGKSTVALYRLRAMIRELRASGRRAPRLLFTTYTNALVQYHLQLLTRLLGPDIRFVEVRTASAVVGDVLKGLRLTQPIADHKEQMAILQAAVAGTPWCERDEKGKIRLSTAPRMSLEYLLEELNSVIEARALKSLEAYQKLRRVGREVPLGAKQRASVWEVYQKFNEIMQQRRVTTFHRVNSQAAKIVEGGAGPRRYDGVVIDEVQDLEPTLLRLLVELCDSPNRLFITADANQSIYGSQFRWQDVHEDLKLRGRTETLRRNYRSTREIGEAAFAYLREGALDEDGEREYVASGHLPALRPVRTVDEEIAVLAHQLPRAANAVRLGTGACAILVPTVAAGKAIAGGLNRHGVAAAYMDGKALDLEKPVVKVLTLQSAKGLEFPVVAVAGFAQNPHYGMRHDVEKEEVEERLRQERRRMFVGMTRAMRVLFVLPPATVTNPLFEGFDPSLWNISLPAGAHR